MVNHASQITAAQINKIWCPRNPEEKTQLESTFTKIMLAFMHYALLDSKWFYKYKKDISKCSHLIFQLGKGFSSFKYSLNHLFYAAKKIIYRLIPYRYQQLEESRLKPEASRLSGLCLFPQSCHKNEIMPTLLAMTKVILSPRNSN